MPDRGCSDVSRSWVAPGRLRLAVGLGAAAATVPYLALKGAWVAGSSVGMADPAFFGTSTYLVANLLSFGLDAVAVGVALALTYPWGRRLPGWLVLFPMWVATGFLGTIAVLVPVAAPLAAAIPAGGSGGDPLQSWVYVLVYGGFAAQGLLLLTAFVLYARQRWPRAFRLRVIEVGARGDRSLPAPLVMAGCALAVLVGVLNLAWAAGVTTGLDDLSERQTAVDRATLGVYAVFALAAAAGPAMLQRSRPARAPLWLPLALTWAGTGSMFAWGFYFLAIAAADPTLSTPALSLAAGVKVLAAGLVAAGMLLVRDRFGWAGPLPAPAS